MTTTDRTCAFTHGMEIEQFPNLVGRAARDYTMNNSVGTLTSWHHDASGPREISVGPAKNLKSILNTFYKDTRDEGITWDWHASDGTRGAGSHVHLSVAPDVVEDQVSAWTIAYNTVVEVTPFLAPFFCHNWQDGFRDGVRSGRRGLVADYWASPTLTRFSQDTVQERVENPSRYSRSYEAVTFNPSQGNSKPLTIELRLNDAHPAMALNGLLLLRRVTANAIRNGWSPKLENHSSTLRACYEKIYQRATEVGLLTAMQEPIDGGIVFADGRGLPGIKRTEFDSMWDVLKAIMNANPQTPGSWRRRGHELVRTGRDENGPQNNARALWNIDAPKGEFRWDCGVEVVA